MLQNKFIRHALVLMCWLSDPASGFVAPLLHTRTLSSAISPRFSSSNNDDVIISSATSTITDNIQSDHQEEKEDDVVRSPLRFLGPYPTIPLRFPNLATSSQRGRNITGISLDFVLDTAANTNTINAQVAKELELEKVGEAPGGVGAAGGIVGGDTFLLGDCELDLSVGMGMEQEKTMTMQRDLKERGDGDEEDKKEGEADAQSENFTFMQQLTASALPVASPAAAGLLSLAFFYCFEGGVEFNWGNSVENPIPSITFYGSDKHLNTNGLTRVPFESLPVSMLPSVILNINGVEIPALFDTGSPITVLNARAAEAAGIATCIPLEDVDPERQQSANDSNGGGGWNPFAKLASNIQSASKIADATARGDILTIAGTDGRPVRLVKSLSPLEVKLSTGEEGDSDKPLVILGEKNVFIGDLPGLAALGGLGGGAAPPAAVLGMDLLRCCQKIVFRAQQNEIYI